MSIALESPNSAPDHPAPDGAALWDSGTRLVIEHYRREAMLTANAAAIAIVVMLIITVSPDPPIPRSSERWFPYLGTFAALLLVGGLAAIWRARQWRLLLAGAAWRAYDMVWVPRTRELPHAALVLTPGDPEEGDSPLLRFGSAFRWQRAALTAASGTVVWLAGDPAQRAVLALPASGVLLPARALNAPDPERYQEAASAFAAADPALLAERRAAAERTYRIVRLRAAAIWLALLLTALARPTTVTAAALALYAVAFAIMTIRARLAHGRAMADTTFAHGRAMADT